MTPINPATAGGLPVNSNGSGYAPQTVDPSAPGFVQYVDPYAAPYVDPYAQQAAVDPYAMQYMDPAYAQQAYGVVEGPGLTPQVVSPQAVTSQPAVTSAPTATVQDFVDLGIFTDQELAEISQGSPEELGVLYQRSVAFMQTPEFEQLLAQQQGMAQGPQVEPQPQSMQQAQESMSADPQADADSGKPGWNASWEKKFKTLMANQGLDSKTQMAVLSQMRTLPLSEAELRQAIAYYRSPAGKKELKGANEQVLAGNATANKLMLGMGGLALAAGAATTKLAGSRGNLETALRRTVAAGVVDGADDAVKLRASAAKLALDELDAGKLPGQLSRAAREEAILALRDQAKNTNRALHPFAKTSLNAAARGITPGTSLGFKEAAKYGLMMNFGDNVPEAAKGVRVLAGGADEASRGLGTLGKFSRALGPLGLVAGAGFGIYGIKKTMEAEGGFGKESAKMTGNVAGGIGGAVAGATAGAMIGSAVPVIGTGVGAIVGGVVGGIGVGKIGEKVGGLLSDIF